MKISPINNNVYKNPSFGAASVSINSFSDTHGSLQLANSALEEMRYRQNDIFYPEEKGKANVMAICGDWFIDGNKSGFKTNPKKKNAFFQLDILNEFIKQAKVLANNNLTVLFTSGNHEFDGGVPLLDEVLSNMDAEVVMTNVDTKNSPALEKSISKNKIVNEKIIEVEDDKNPNLKNKILFLGIIPVNMAAYQKETNGVSITDNIPKSQIYVEKEDYENTLNDCKDRIRKFKKENKNGIVILMNHTGVNFANNLARESEVNLVFDGHEHKNNMRFVNRTPIVSLSMNFKKIVNAKIDIDDEGKLKRILLNQFCPLDNKENGPILDLYTKLFKDDIEEKYSITTDNPRLEMLDIHNIRVQNNYLANFITDSILEEIRKKDKTVDFFALNSSSIRHPLRVSESPCISNLDIMNVLEGIREDEGKIMTTEVTGKDIVYMVLDNFTFNEENPKRNPLIHYSGLITDKTNMLKDYKAGKNIEELAKYVTDTRTNEPLELDKVYKIANPEKYFKKSQNKKIRDLKESSSYTEDTVQSLFKKYFEESDGNIHIKCEERIK